MMETNPQTTEQSAAARKVRRNRKVRRTLGGALALTFALTSAGLLASALTPDKQTATAEQSQAALVAEGKQLFDVACVTCHGANLEGIKDRGVSLIGVGEAAAYFQLATGRMPAIRNEAQAIRKTPRFSEQQILAISAYIDSVGGGPGIVRNEDGTVAQESLQGDNWSAEHGIDPADVASGSELFRLNCASCHNFTGKGGALSSGKFAPPLAEATEQDIYTAMLSGPQNMPKFSDRQLSPEAKKDIIAFLKSQDNTPTQGGMGLGGIGPVTEGMWMWLVGISILIAAALWIGSRS